MGTSADEKRAQRIAELEAGADAPSEIWFKQAGDDLLLAYLKGRNLSDEAKATINVSLEILDEDQAQAHQYLGNVALAVSKGAEPWLFQQSGLDGPTEALPAATSEETTDGEAEPAGAAGDDDQGSSQPVAEGEGDQGGGEGATPGGGSGDEDPPFDNIGDLLVWIGSHLDGLSEEDQAFLDNEDETDNGDWIVSNAAAIARAIKAGEPIPRPGSEPEDEDVDDLDDLDVSSEPYADLTVEELRELIRDEGGAAAVDAIDQRVAFLPSEKVLPYLRQYALAIVEGREPAPLDEALGREADQVAADMARSRNAVFEEDEAVAARVAAEGHPAPPTGPPLGEEDVDGLRVGMQVRVGVEDRYSDYNGHVGFIQEISTAEDGKPFLVGFGGDPLRPERHFARGELTPVVSE